jgi:hypothetical protein
MADKPVMGSVTKKVGSTNKESWEQPFESFLSNLLPLHLEVLNLPFLMELGRIIFFQI